MCIILSYYTPLFPAVASTPRASGSIGGASTPTSGTRRCLRSRPPAAPAAPPISRRTRNRVDKGSLVGEPRAAEADIDGFLAERHVLRRHIPIRKFGQSGK